MNDYEKFNWIIDNFKELEKPHTVLIKDKYSWFNFKHIEFKIYKYKLHSIWYYDETKKRFIKEDKIEKYISDRRKQKEFNIKKYTEIKKLNKELKDITN